MCKGGVLGLPLVTTLGRGCAATPPMFIDVHGNLLYLVSGDFALLTR
jgi:hypothetical protein